MNKTSNTKIEISGYEFTHISRFNCTQTLSQPSYLEFDLKLDEPISNLNLLKADFRETITFTGPLGIMFSGYIVSITSNNEESEIITVFCTDLIGLLMDDKFSNFKIRGKEYHADLLGLVLDLSKINSSIDLPSYHTEMRLFRILIPLKCLEITNEMNLGKCRLFSILPDIKLIKENDEFNKSSTFIEISVSEKSIYKSLEMALLQIATAVSILNYRINILGMFRNYQNKNQQIKILLGNIVYIEDKKYQTQIIMAHPWSFTNGYSLGNLTENYFLPVKQLSDRLVNDDYLSNKQKQKEIWILYYLMKAENSTNNTEAFLLLWLSLEFLVSRFYKPKDPKFTKKEVKELIEYVLNYSSNKDIELNILEESGKINSKERQIRKMRYGEIEMEVRNLVHSQINYLSLNNKIKYLLALYGLDLTEKEKITYNRARKIRNQIIHGKENMEPMPDDYNIISKIIYFIIYQALLSPENS